MKSQNQNLFFFFGNLCNLKKNKNKKTYHIKEFKKKKKKSNFIPVIKRKKKFIPKSKKAERMY